MLFIKWTNPGINKRLYEILLNHSSNSKLKRYHKLILIPISQKFWTDGAVHVGPPIF